MLGPCYDSVSAVESGGKLLRIPHASRRTTFPSDYQQHIRLQLPKKNPLGLLSLSVTLFSHLVDYTFVLVYRGPDHPNVSTLNPSHWIAQKVNLGFGTDPPP